MSTVHLPARAYVAVPLEVTMEELPHAVGGAFDRVAAMLAAHGAPSRGGVIRYIAFRPAGLLDIEVGHLVDAGDLDGSPIEPDVLPEGEYSTVAHDGPYARIASVTAALMDSWPDAGVTPATAHTSTGDDFACWYELYLDMPRMGPDGPEGKVEVCVLVAEG
ncbi:GyrI-like domain-containing protein [Demequina iriomotensis]|uniref:GyrI-like domain-containing protein n=1 Tax=Demequina iriomotensis TaxID=1536641 RepID=UPI000781BA10|nr:GyrI-like domain-containing protein [Demequina iriomotensis]